MSATMRQLTFGLVVNDPDQWTPESRQAAENDPGGTYDDWAVGPLYDAMMAAGEAYIAEHPDLFRGGLI